MNITTYATPVSIEPKPRFMVALYKNTKSYDNFIQGDGRAVLQILTREQQALVAVLGKQSGFDVDKHALVYHSHNFHPCASYSPNQQS